MATSAVTVGIKLTVDGKDVEGALSLTSAQLQKLSDATSRASSEAKQYNEANKGLIDTLRSHSEVIKGLAAAYGLYKVADYVKDATLLAARYETLGIVMNLAGQNAGYNAKQMQDYATALEKTGISMNKTREALTKMSTANIDLAKSTQLGRVAQDLAVVANQNSSDTLERLIINIQQMDTVGLRHMGIVISQEEAMQRYATANNMAVSAMTRHQREQAVLNAVMQEGAKYNGIYERSMETAGKAMLSLERYFENLKIKVGQPFLEGFAKGIFGVTDGVKKLNQWMDELEKNGGVEKMAKEFGQFVGKAISDIRSFLQELKFFLQWINQFIPSVENLGRVVMGLGIVTALWIGDKAVVAWGKMTLATLSAETGLLASLARMTAAIIAFGAETTAAIGSLGWAGALAGVVVKMETVLGLAIVAAPVTVSAAVITAGLAIGYALSDNVGKGIFDGMTKLMPEWAIRLSQLPFALVDAATGGWVSDTGKYAPPAAAAAKTAPYSNKGRNDLNRFEQDNANAERARAEKEAKELAEIKAQAAISGAEIAISAAKREQIETKAINDSIRKDWENDYEDRIITHENFLKRKFQLDQEDLQKQMDITRGEIAKAQAEANSPTAKDKAKSLREAAELTAKLHQQEWQLFDMENTLGREVAKAHLEDMWKRNGTIAATIDATKDLINAAREEVQNAGKTRDELEVLKGTRLGEAVAQLEQQRAKLMGIAGSEQEIALINRTIAAYKDKILAHKEMAAAILGASIEQKAADLEKETLSIYQHANEDYAMTAQERIKLAGENALKEVEIERDKQEKLLDLLEIEYGAKGDTEGLDRVGQARQKMEESFAHYKEAINKNTTAKIEAENRKQQMATVKDLEQEFRNSWTEIFTQGRKGWSDMVDKWKQKLKTYIADYLFDLFAKPFVLNIIASLAGIVGATGVANAAAGAIGAAGGNAATAGSWLGIASAAEKAYTTLSKGWTAFTTGMSNTFQAVLNSSVGQSLGFSTAASAGYSAPVYASAAEGGGLISAGSGTAGGLTSAGQSATTMAGYAGQAGIAAIGFYAGLKLAGDKIVLGLDGKTTTTIGAIIGTTILPGIGTAIGAVIGGSVNALFGMGPKKPQGDARTLGKFDMSGFSEGRYAQDWKKEGGLFRSDKHGTDYSAVPQDQADAFYAIMVGTQQVFTKLAGVAGDATKSLEGWSFSFDRVLNTEEQQKGLLNDLANSMGAKLLPDLKNFQKQGESLADTAVRLTDEFLLTDKMAALLGKDTATAFGATGLASLKARDNMVELMGGVQQMASTVQSFYQNYFTEEERHAIDLEQLATQFRAIGVSMPSTRDGFRQLVEAQDQTTESGRQTFAALMSLSGAFASVVSSASNATNNLTSTQKLMLQIAQITGDTLLLTAERDRLRTAALAEIKDPQDKSLQRKVWQYQDNADRNAMIESLKSDGTKLSEAMTKVSQSGFPQTIAGFNSMAAGLQLMADVVPEVVSADGELEQAGSDLATAASETLERMKLIAPALKLVTDAMDKTRAASIDLGIQVSELGGKVFDNLGNEITYQTMILAKETKALADLNAQDPSGTLAKLTQQLWDLQKAATLSAATANVRSGLQAISTSLNSFIASLASADAGVVDAKTNIQKAYFDALDKETAAKQAQIDVTNKAVESFNGFKLSVEEFLEQNKAGGETLQSQKSKLSATAVLAKAGDEASRDKLVKIAQQVMDTSMRMSSTTQENERNKAWVTTLLKDVMTTVQPKDSAGKPITDTIQPAKTEVQLAQDAVTSATAQVTALKNYAQALGIDISASTKAYQEANGTLIALVKALTDAVNAQTEANKNLNNPLWGANALAATALKPGEVLPQSYGTDAMIQQVIALDAARKAEADAVAALLTKPATAQQIADAIAGKQLTVTTASGQVLNVGLSTTSDSVASALKSTFTFTGGSLNAPTASEIANALKGVDLKVINGGTGLAVAAALDAAGIKVVGIDGTSHVATAAEIVTAMSKATFSVSGVPSAAYFTLDQMTTAFTNAWTTAVGNMKPGVIAAKDPVVTAATSAQMASALAGNLSFAKTATYVGTTVDAVAEAIKAAIPNVGQDQAKKNVSSPTGPTLNISGPTGPIVDGPKYILPATIADITKALAGVNLTTIGSTTAQAIQDALTAAGISDMWDNEVSTASITSAVTGATPATLTTGAAVDPTAMANFNAWMATLWPNVASVNKYMSDHHVTLVDMYTAFNTLTDKSLVNFTAVIDNIANTGGASGLLTDALGKPNSNALLLARVLGVTATSTKTLTQVLSEKLGLTSLSAATLTGSMYKSTDGVKSFAASIGLGQVGIDALTAVMPKAGNALLLLQEAMGMPTASAGQLGQALGLTGSSLTLFTDQVTNKVSTGLDILAAAMELPGTNLSTLDRQLGLANGSATMFNSALAESYSAQNYYTMQVAAAGDAVAAFVAKVNAQVITGNGGTGGTAVTQAEKQANAEGLAMAAIQDMTGKIVTKDDPNVKFWATQLMSEGSGVTNENVASKIADKISTYGMASKTGYGNTPLKTLGSGVSKDVLSVIDWMHKQDMLANLEKSDSNVAFRNLTSPVFGSAGVTISGAEGKTALNQFIANLMGGTWTPSEFSKMVSQGILDAGPKQFNAKTRKSALAYLQGLGIHDWDSKDVTTEWKAPTTAQITAAGTTASAWANTFSPKYGIKTVGVAATDPTWKQLRTLIAGGDITDMLGTAKFIVDNQAAFNVNTVADTRAWLQSKSIEGYAKGGLAAPGWAVVGEAGPELVNFHSPARVFNATDTREAMMSKSDNTEVVAELRAVKAELASLRRAAEVTANSTTASESFMRRVSPDGNSLLVTVNP